MLMLREAGSFVSEISGKRNAMKTGLASSTNHFIIMSMKAAKEGLLTWQLNGAFTIGK